MSPRAIARLVIAALVAGAPQLVVAQPGPEPDPLPDPGPYLWVGHACLATPLGRECHEIKYSGLATFDGWWDRYGDGGYIPVYHWSYDATITGTFLLPTAELHYSYEWDGGERGDRGSMHIPFTPARTGAYRVEHGGVTYTWWDAINYPFRIDYVILDRANDDRVEFEFVAGPIPAVVTPEPATVALLAGGLLVIAGVGVGRRNW